MGQHLLLSKEDMNYSYFSLWGDGTVELKLFAFRILQLVDYLLNFPLTCTEVLKDFPEELYVRTQM